MAAFITLAAPGITQVAIPPPQLILAQSVSLRYVHCDCTPMLADLAIASDSANGSGSLSHSDSSLSPSDSLSMDSRVLSTDLRLIHTTATV
eukprot:1266483-Amphidinium_carterae.1